MNHLQILALCRVRELQDEAYKIHQELMVWRETPLTEVERTHRSVTLKSKLEQADTWLRATIGTNLQLGYYPAKLEDSQ